MQIGHNHPVRFRLPPLHRRGIAGCRYDTTTPSGCACHPSTGGELPGADTMQSPQCICTRHLPSTGGNCRVQTRCNRPSVSVLDISPPQEGNCRVQTRHNRPSVSVLDISPPQEGNCLVQTRHNHPVRLRLPPLQRRGIDWCRHDGAVEKVPPLHKLNRLRH